MSSVDYIRQLLAESEPWRACSESVRDEIAAEARVVQFAVGETIVSGKGKSENIYLVASGRVRSLGIIPGEKEPVSLELLDRGSAFGWTSAIAGRPCEIAVASHASACVTLSVAQFLALVDREPLLRERFRERPGLPELFHLLAADSSRQAKAVPDLRNKAAQALAYAVARSWSGNGSAAEFPPDFVWLVSSGTADSFGERWHLPNGSSPAQPTETRLVGVPADLLGEPATEPRAGPDQAPPIVPEIGVQTPSAPSYPEVRGEGELESVLACFEMVCRQFERPFPRHVLRRVLANQLDRSPSISLKQCGAVAELAGLDARLAAIAPASLPQIEPPAFIRCNNALAVVFEIDEKGAVLGCPATGVQRVELSAIAPTSTPGAREVLLLQPGAAAIEEEPFGIRWFLPAIKRHRRVLIEVLVASFFVQLFTLANPLLTQVIIDKVLVQNSGDTLNTLGLLLLVVAFFAALLTGLRTYLFVDTTNRIDLALGSTIINRLYRLSLNYFGKRPVGEIATRLNELENIRQFLTGTALTLVLDGVFSVVYLAVMIAYSVPLTIAAVAAVPVLGALTFFVAPVLRRQLRVRAQQYSQTQSYLVETLGGIQTVKAQNLELHARWNWQERYSRFVSAGFRTVLTSTSMSSISSFLSRLSDLAVLWFGAYLVIQRQLTIGQLIAFRIISGYVASPLLRLVQSWQQFQEVGLSIERLGDILDSPREQDEVGAKNIPMPLIDGAVTFHQINFAYVKGSAPQLRDVNFEIPAGAFVGVVGQSGSGKSTLLKLLPRLYRPDSGRIFIDQYDVAKVELYSLRRQVGVVLQDSLLFDGTVQENIALADPDAAPEIIVQAAKVAAAHEFIMSLAEGYNTRVGEGGRALSGGQRQRIAIARAVLQNPRLLVLDEATSALDFITERQVCDNLAKAFAGRTVFFVTHRLRSIQSAGTILFLEEGMIVERGTHAELLKLRGRYATLHDQQGIAG